MRFLLIHRVHYKIRFKIEKKFFLKILFIYGTERQPAREGTQQGSGRGRSRLIAEEEPDVGLNLRTPGLLPEPKADA